MTELAAISLWQPWAALIAVGAKTIETRGWPPAVDRVGGLYAIHAAKRFPEEARRACDDPEIAGALLNGGMDVRHLPHGVVLAVGKLADRYQIPWSGRGTLPQWFPLDKGSLERKVGGYAPGRWLWYFPEVERLAQPVACRGWPSVFLLDHNTAQTVLVQTKWA